MSAVRQVCPGKSGKDTKKQLSSLLHSMTMGYLKLFIDFFGHFLYPVVANPPVVIVIGHLNQIRSYCEVQNIP